MSNNNMNNERNPFVEATMKPMEEEIKNAHDKINERNGVRYVNTTHKEFINMMYGRDNASNFNLSAIKVNEYKCDLGPAPDDASKDWGAIYLFPHYLIKSPKYRIEPDIEDTDFVDITYICTYNELLTVLIDKKDMSCPGFKKFILDTLDNMLYTVNGCKIPKTRDPENYLSYRQLMTMICFINKYNECLHIPPYRFKIVLVHTLDECCYRRYAIATIAENGTIRGDKLNNTLNDKTDNKPLNYSNNEDKRFESDSNDCICNAISDVMNNNIMPSDEQFKHLQEISNEVQKVFGFGAYKINITCLDNYPVDDDGNVISSDDCYDIVIEIDKFCNDIKFFGEFSLEVKDKYSIIFDIIRKFELDNEQFKNAEVGARFKLEFTIPGNNPDSIFKKLKIDGWKAKKIKGKLSTYVFDVYVEKDKTIQLCYPDIHRKYINKKK